MNSILHRFAYFLALVDHDEMAGCGPYDRALIYASFVRQILGVSFVFIVFLFAWVSVLPLWTSFLIAAVSSLIVLFLDQAIIGSEWTLHKEFGSIGIFSGIGSFVLKVFKLAPRIAYAVFVALFIATLAELALQSRAIDRVLQEETKSSNKVYFEKKEALVTLQNDKLKVVDDDIKTLEAAIKAKLDPSNATTSKELEARQKDTNSSINLLTQQLSVLLTEKLKTENLLRDQKTKVENAQADIKGVVEQKALELLGERCRNPGSELCKGQRWTEFNKVQITAETTLATIKPEYDANNSRLKEIIDQIGEIQKEIDSRHINLESLSRTISTLQTDDRSMDELKAARGSKITERASLLDAQNVDSNNLNTELITGGYFSAADYDPLDRYVGLNKLYQDKEKGEAAKRFSFGLKIFIILFELSPVLVTIFFTPFSFYAQKMRSKRDRALVEGIEARLQVESKIDEVKTRAYEAKLNEKLRRNEAYEAYKSKKTEKAWGWLFQFRAKYQEQRKRLFEMRKANNISEDVHNKFRDMNNSRKGK